MPHIGGYHSVVKFCKAFLACSNFHCPVGWWKQNITSRLSGRHTVYVYMGKGVSCHVWSAFYKGKAGVCPPPQPRPTATGNDFRKIIFESDPGRSKVRRPNGFLGLSLNIMTTQFLVILLGSQSQLDKTVFALRRSPEVRGYEGRTNEHEAPRSQLACTH